MTDHTPNSKVSRLEVVSTGARRRWTLEEKQRIVAESYCGARLVSVTARRNGLSASQLFTWRRLAREDRLSDVPGLEAALRDLSGKFTNEKMQKLNFLVDGEHQPVSKVASEFLSHSGF